LTGERGKFYYRACDLSEEADIRSLFSWIEKHPDLGRVDICVNNAGFSSANTLLDGDFASWRKMMDVNVLALCLCTQLSIKSMTDKKINEGQIIMISSMSGHRVPPNPSTRFYSATKFAVTGLLEGWRQEVRDLGSNIRVSAISPGLVETEFQSVMYPEDPARAEAIQRSVECLQDSDISSAVRFVLASPPHMMVHDILVRPTLQKF